VREYLYELRRKGESALARLATLAASRLFQNSKPDTTREVCLLEEHIMNGLNPAAIVAFCKGDFDNFLVAATPGGIEAQEAQGQQSFVASTTLPIRINTGERKDLEIFGVKFGDPVDDLFCEAQLPEGWHKEATEHSMWSRLLDNQGRERATIFYKAAFYDRNAHISLVRRLSCSVDPVDGWEDPAYSTKAWVCNVKAGEILIWSSEPIEPEPAYHRGESDEKRAIWLAWQDKKDRLREHGIAWLQEHYPEWQRFTAYWDVNFSEEKGNTCKTKQ
jgi:hypothetical protein